jgi:hypothetical protein
MPAPHCYDDSRRVAMIANRFGGRNATRIYTTHVFFIGNRKQAEYLHINRLHCHSFRSVASP